MRSPASLQYKMFIKFFGKIRLRIPLAENTQNISYTEKAVSPSALSSAGNSNKPFTASPARSGLPYP